jgi:hypothetical protein
MESSDELTKVRDEAYRRIGRNIIIFQQIEKALKFILSRSRFSGSVEDIQKTLVKWDRSTMGQLVEPLIETIFTAADFPESLPSDGSKISFSYAFCVELTVEQRADFQKSLQMIVTERNELVHHAITLFEFGSVEGCTAACEKLQAQRELAITFRNRIRGWLEAIIQSHLNLQKESEPGGVIHEELKKHLRSG